MASTLFYDFLSLMAAMFGESGCEQGSPNCLPGRFERPELRSRTQIVFETVVILMESVTSLGCACLALSGATVSQSVLRAEFPR